MRVRLLVSLLLLALPVARGQSFLTLPVSPVEAALGGAGLTEATAFAPLLNPARLGGLRRAAAAASVLRYGERTATLATGVVPIGRRFAVGAFAAGFVAPEYGSVVTPDGEPGTQLRNAQAGLAVAARSGALSGGVSARLVVDRAPGVRDETIAFDAGLAATFGGDDLVLALAARHLGEGFSGRIPDCEEEEGVSCYGTAYALPVTGRAGAAWRAFTLRGAQDDVPLGRLRLVAEGAISNEDGATLALGAEAEALDLVVLRLGRLRALTSGYSGDRWTLGAGLRLGRLSADVAFLPGLNDGYDDGFLFGVRVGR